MTEKLTEQEELDRFAANQILRMISKGYMEAITTHLPINLLVKYAAEAYVWFLQSLKVSTEAGIAAIVEASPRIEKRAAEIDAKIETIRREIDKDPFALAPLPKTPGLGNN